MKNYGSIVSNNFVFRNINEDIHQYLKVMFANEYKHINILYNLYQNPVRFIKKYKCQLDKRKDAISITYLYKKIGKHYTLQNIRS